MNQKSKNIQKYLYPVLYGAFGMLGLLLGITCWIMDRDAYPHLYPFFMMVALFCLAACGIVLVFNVIYLADMYLKNYGKVLKTILQELLFTVISLVLFYFIWGIVYEFAEWFVYGSL